MSVGLVNNEIGTVQPLDDVAAVVRERAPEAVLHTDAAQALTWLDLRTAAAAADLITWRPTSAAVRSASGRWWCAPG